MKNELPHTPIYVSCSTLAGREAADARLSPLVDGVFYAPFDVVFAVRGALRSVRPSVLVVMETEIWPNLYREARRAGASVIVVNGRISDKTAASYQKHSWFFQAVFDHVDCILTQSAEDQRRYVASGAPVNRVRVGGNLKYDFEVKAGAAPELVTRSLRRPLWIAASTTGPMRDGDVDEDDAVIAAYTELVVEWPELQLLVAPRKPERFDVVAAKLQAAGMRFVRRSKMQGGEDADVILLDSVGDLSSLFPYADVVFMGGTLCNRGGHNILEPALCAKAVVAGPHLENFAAVRDRFSAARGYVPIDSDEELRGAVAELLGDAGRRESLGARARALAESERGATSRALRAITAQRWQFVPRSLPYGWARLLLRVLSRIWIAGGAWKQSRAEPRRLATRVVSIGGLAMGGAGKTPMACYIAELLRIRGHRPAILTRGYKRQSSRIACLAMGSQPPIHVTGDEAQLLLRYADVGIGADRWAAGVAMEEHFRPSVFLLDDGFQHTRLQRDVDIVLLDGIDPLGGDAVFPEGRLREPVEALARADILVVTRAGRRRFDGLLARLPEDKVIFLADVEVTAWIPDRPPLDAVAAFCGLANPLTFFETLHSEGARVVSTHVFPDHHRYTPEDIRSVAQAALESGARVLVTSEKDWVNLPAGFERFAQPFEVRSVAIRTRIRNESSFIARLESLMGASSIGRAGR
jgi:tetraacyldisaccharide 4'-kinase